MNCSRTKLCNIAKPPRPAEYAYFSARSCLRLFAFAAFTIVRFLYTYRKCSTQLGCVMCLVRKCILCIFAHHHSRILHVVDLHACLVICLPSKR